MSETSTSNLTASKLEILKTRLRNDRENALAKLAIRKKRRKKQLKEGGKPNNYLSAIVSDVTMMSLVAQMSMTTYRTAQKSSLIFLEGRKHSRC